LNTIGWSSNSETATKWTTTHRNGIDAHELRHARAQPARGHACCANNIFFFEGEGDEPKGLLGKNLNIYIVLKGVQGISYINPARRIEQIARNPVAIEEWSRPVTVWTLNGPP
jgi:hypothetical protein